MDVAVCKEAYDQVAEGGWRAIDALLAVFPAQSRRALLRENLHDEDRTLLLECCQDSDDDVDLARVLINHGSDIEQQDKNGANALYLAARHGNIAIVKMLVDEHHANVNYRKANGWTPLLAASTHGHFEAAEFLLQQKADVHAANDDARTSLHMAATEGHENIVYLLLEHGARTNRRDRHGDTPLDDAKKKSQQSVVALLSIPKVKLRQHQRAVRSIRKREPWPSDWPVSELYRDGIQLMAIRTGKDREHIFALAARQGSTAIFEGLEAEMADESFYGFEAQADEYPQQLEVGSRVARGRDWKWGEQDGGSFGTVTSTTVEEGWVGVRWDSGGSNNYRYNSDARDLRVVQDGSSTSAPGAGLWRSPFMSDHEEYPEVLEVGSRVKRGRDWKWGDQDGGGPGTVIEASDGDGWVGVRWDSGGTNKYRYNAEARDLQSLQGGSTIGIPATRLRDAFLAACRGGHRAVLDLLLKIYASDSDSDDAARFPLHEGFAAACESGHLDITKFLLEQAQKMDDPLEVSRPVSSGSTALHLAARNGHLSIVELLLGHQAGLEERDEDGNTPLLVAAAHGHANVIERLVQAGAKLDAKNSSDEGALELALLVQDRKAFHALVRLDANGRSFPYEEVLVAMAFFGMAQEVTEVLQLRSRCDLGFSLEMALQAACAVGHREVTRKLLEAGADINAEFNDSDDDSDSNGSLQSGLASDDDDQSLDEESESEGDESDNSEEEDGGQRKHHDDGEGRVPHGDDTALSGPVAVGNIDFARWLVDDQKASCSRGFLLHHAVETKSPWVICEVLDMGAPTNHRNKQGQLASDLEEASDTSVRTVLQASERSRSLMLEVFRFMYRRSGSRDLDTIRRVTAPHSQSLGDLRAANFSPPLLHQAAVADAEGLVAWLCESGFDVHAADNDGRRALHAAAASGSKAGVEALIRGGAQIDVKDSSKATPLLLAVEAGELDVISVLVKHGAAPDAICREGLTPLHAAVRSDKLAALKRMLAEGKITNVDVRGEHKQTALLEAAKNGRTEAFVLLMQAGANCELQDDEGRDSLFQAARFGYVDIVAAILDPGVGPNKRLSAEFLSGPRVNAQGLSPLNAAAVKGHVVVVATLLSHGADRNICDMDGDTPLDNCRRQGQKAMIRLLELPDALTKSYCSAIQWLERGDLTELKAALECMGPASVSAICSHEHSNGKRLVHQLLDEQLAEALVLFTDSYPQLWRDGTSKHPSGLIYAIQRGLPADLLQELDLSAFPRETQEAAVHCAAQLGRIDYLAFLVGAAHFLLEATDKDMRTPLLIAIDASQASSTRWLLDRGARRDTADSKGRTPASAAKSSTNPDIFSLLVLSNEHAGLLRKLSQAVLSGNQDDVRAILSKDSMAVDLINLPRARQRTLIHTAAFRGNEGMVDLLLRHGGKHDVQDMDGNTPALVAAKQGHVKVALSLWRKGRDSRARIVGESMTLLHILAASVALDAMHVEELKDLLDVKNGNGETPLHLAAGSLMDGNVCRLILAGCASDAKDKQGKEAIARVPSGADGNRAYAIRHILAQKSPSARSLMAQLYLSVQQSDKGLFEDAQKRLRALPLDEARALLSGKVAVFDGNILHLAACGRFSQPVKHHFHPHSLQMVERDTGWQCDGRRVGESHVCLLTKVEWKLEHHPRFRCTQGCDYDLCLCCMFTSVRSSVPADGDTSPAEADASGSTLSATEAKDTKRESPLDPARSEGFEEATLPFVRELLQVAQEVGVDIHATDQAGRSALWYAASFNSQEACKAIINVERDGHVRQGEPRQFSPLHIAALAGHGESLIRILAAKNMVDALAQDKQTALHVAAVFGRDRVVNTLLESQADPCLLDSNSHTALYTSARWGYQDVVKAILKQRSDKFIDQICSRNRWTALNCAAHHGHRDTVELLLEKGADPSLKDKDGDTALQNAVRQNHYDVAALLQLPRGVSAAVLHDLDKAVNSLDKKKLEAVLAKAGSTESQKQLLAIRYGAKQESSLHQLLRKHGTHTDAKSLLDCCRVLLEKGADPGLSDQEQHTPLSLAVDAGSVELVKLVLKYCRDPGSVSSPGGEPLLVRAIGFEQVFQHLLTVPSLAGDHQLQTALEAAGDDKQLACLQKHVCDGLAAKEAGDQARVTKTVAQALDRHIARMEDGSIRCRIIWVAEDLSVRQAAHLPRVCSSDITFRYSTHDECASLALIAAFGLYDYRPDEDSVSREESLQEASDRFTDRRTITSDTFQLSSGRVEQRLPSFVFSRTKVASMLLKLPAQKSCGLTAGVIDRLVTLLKEKCLDWEGPAGLGVIDILHEEVASMGDNAVLRAISYLRSHVGLDEAAMKRYREMVSKDSAENANAGQLLDRLDDFSTLGSDEWDCKFLNDKASELLVQKDQNGMGPLGKVDIAKNAKRLRKLLSDSEVMRRHVERQFWSCREEGSEYDFVAAWELVSQSSSSAMDSVYVVEKQMNEDGHGQDVVRVTRCPSLDLAFARHAFSRNPALALMVQQATLPQWRYGEELSLPLKPSSIIVEAIEECSDVDLAKALKRMEKGVSRGQLEQRRGSAPSRQYSRSASTASKSHHAPKLLHDERLEAMKASVEDLSPALSNGIQLSYKRAVDGTRRSGWSKSRDATECECFIFDHRYIHSSLMVTSLHRTAQDGKIKDQYKWIYARASARHLWRASGSKSFLLFASLQVMLLILLMVRVNLLYRNDSSTWSLAQMVLHGVLAFFFVCDFLSELFVFARQGLRAYLFDFWNLLDFVRMMAIGSFLGYTLLDGSSEVATRALAASSIYLAWFKILEILRPYVSTGRFVVMVMQVLSDIKVFLLIVGIFMLAFASSMSVLASPELVGYSDFPSSMFTAFETLLFAGYEPFLLDVESWPIASVSVTIFIVSMFFVGVVLLNLLIAILSDSYERVQDSAMLETSFVLAGHVLEMDKSIMALFLKAVGLLGRKEPPKYLLLLKPKRVPMISMPPTDHSISFLTTLKEHVSTSSDMLMRKVDGDIAALQQRHDESLMRVTEANREVQEQVAQLGNGQKAKIDKIIQMLEASQKLQAAYESRLQSVQNNLASMKGELASLAAREPTA